MQRSEVLTVRPGELMCVICKVGAGCGRDLGNPGLNRIMQILRKDPRFPAQLANYQGTPRPDIAANNRLFEMRRDLEILGRLGSIKRGGADRKPILQHVMNIMRMVPSTQDICGYDSETSPIWKNCLRAKSGQYENGRTEKAAFFTKLLPRSFMRTQAERDQAKEESVKTIHAAREIRIFPNHLKCITCHYGNGLDFIQPNPLHHDNLFEVAEAMRRNPDIPVKVINHHCMVCPPCGGLDTANGLCGLRCARLTRSDQVLQDMGGPEVLRIMQALGMDFDESLPAGKIMQRVYERLTTTVGTCAWDRCNQPGAYYRGRKGGLGFLDAYEDAPGVVARVAKLLADRTIRQLLPEHEQRLMTEKLAQARAALKSGDRKKAYQALIDRAFWNCWKTYLEKAFWVQARLPKSMAVQRESTAGERTISAGCVRKPICCDGNLNKPAWRQGPWSAGFQTAESRPALTETGVKIRYDRTHLYAAFAVADQDTRRLKADARIGTELMYKTTPRFEAEISQGIGAYPWHEADDSVSVFIQPDETKTVYYQFIINPNGVKAAQRFDVAQGTRTATLLPDTGQWQAAVNREQKLWTVEMAIPFDMIGGVPRTGKSRAGWRINFHRVFGQEVPGPRIVFSRNTGYEYVNNRKKIQPPRGELLAPESWSYSSGKTWPAQWHDVNKFGRLVFS